MKSPVKFLPFVLGISILLSLILLIHPWSLSPQTSSFSLSLDLDSSAGDQAASSLDVSPDQVVSMQIFGKDIQNAYDLSTLFEYDTTQVVYEKFAVSDVLPNPLVEQDSTFGLPQAKAFVQIDMASLEGSTTANSSLIGTLHFRTTDAFSSTEIRLVRAGLGREGKFETVTTAISVALQVAAAPSPDFDGSGTVDFSDFLAFVSAFGSEEGQDNYDAKYDLNRDSKIAFEDFQILTDNFGKIVVAQKSPTPPKSPKLSAQSTPASSPDLIVESFSVSDSSPDAGASFTLSATVRNQGNGTSPILMTLNYYLSTDETISTSDTEVGWDLVSRLAASESGDESARVRAPSSGGTYYYGACIEAVSGESDTDNNCSSPVTVTVGSPDLIVEPPSVSDSSPKAGAYFTLSATVRNQGNGTSPILTTLNYYLSTDATISTSDTEVGWDLVSRLAASESGDESARVRAPSSDGTYYYGACIEAVSGESDTDNNCSSPVTVTVGSTTPPPTPNQPPVFSEGASATRSIAENTGAGQNIGNPVSATDGDGDRLTYSLQGRDASAFTIQSNSGQLTTRSGVTYDYETKNSYSVTVRVQDGKGGSVTIAVEITLTDENEPPDRPDAPTITASTLNSLSIRWTAPTNPGPAISGYDVQYRAQGGSFTDWPHTGTGTTTTITGLTANTRYEVQVRARNTQGESNWSPSVNGTTIANQSPVFSEGTSTTRSIAENTGAGQNIGNPVSATDGDSDRLTYSLEGRDASAFTIQSNSGQLMTRSGVTYDYETKNSYSVTVRAQDGKGGSATIAVEITLTDEKEPPGRPDAPTVTAASSTSLKVTWTALDNPGPAISDYDVQYRAGGGSFTNWNHSGTSLSTTITGLTANTRYEVQVRARNTQGESNWSPSGSGTTSSSGGSGGGNNPDLIVESPSVSDSTLGPGESFRLSTTVRNQGGSRSASTTLRYYLSTDATINTSDKEVDTDYVTRLDASEISDESARLTAPPGEGTYYYGACVVAVSGESDTDNNCSGAVTVTVIGSDLVVKSPSVSDSTLGPGESFYLNATVHNQGGSRSASTTLRYYRSSDATIDPGDTEVDTDYVSRLDASESGDESARLTAPPGEGTYYYGACIEAVSGESDTDNNCSGPVTVTVIGPDLVVESPSVSDSSPKAGAYFTLSATVRNQGGSRSVPTTLHYYLSTDATITTGDTELDTDYVSYLAASESGDESARVRAPSSEGTYHYGACIEAVSGESDTDNNCSNAVAVTVGSTTTPPTPNQPPVFSEGTTTTRSIAENTGAGQNIGNPVSATDGDGDRLTYSLQGRDASAFTIQSNSGQLITRLGVTYDYETKNSYSVTVRAQDGKGGSVTIIVEITLTDENEPPDRPDAPTITASTLNSLSIRWTAPTNPGPAISDYDVQYRAEGGSFTDWPHTGTGTTTTITGLTANTRYEVQVRARNTQGESNWSPSVTGTTTTNQSPVFSEGTSTTRSIAENTGAGQNIGNPVSATDGDGDRLTYSLEGRDVSAFTIQSNSGQLITRLGVTYDYETKNSYSVTVRAQDGKGGSATIAVEITLTDENEPPGRPDAPTVTAASSTSLKVTWTAPDNPGPAISDYDVQYRAEGERSFTDWPHTGTGTTTTITGLTANTRYEVQVRATSDEGTGDWSPSGSGTTSSDGGNNPDLVVEPPSVDNNTPAPGQSFRLSTTVRNQGGSRSAPTTLHYYLSTDATITTGDTELDTDYVSYLAASESGDESARLKAPSSDGTYYYGACVEAVSGESDTDNNCSGAVTVTVIGPDLVVEPPSVDNNTPTPGRLIRLRATVRNQGGGRSSSTTLRYYQSTDETIDSGDTEIDTDYVSSLDPSETSDERDLFSAPSSAGTYYYGACVEAVTGESDTGNNCSSPVTVTIRSAPPPPAPNQPPVFSEGTTTTRSIAENTGAGQNIGNPVSATDDDSDRLTYSLQGRDASAFTIQSNSGQLTTRSGVTYDYETQDSYSVTVRAQDGKGGSATIVVEITLTDENEPPDRPDAPVVTASTLNSLSIRWTAPTNPGPAINGYDVQYRAEGGSFIDWPHTGTGTTTTITGLTANTRYEVQVRARNTQGESNWSPSVTGTTIANQSPVFSEGTTTMRSIAENTGAGQNIGNPVSATDGDSDRLTYSLEGRDASAFTIQSNSGQLITGSGVTYDYETQDNYSVTVRAQDGKGGSVTIIVEITLTDENEPPRRPDAPTVTASSNSLSIRWAAPENTGPAISDYDVQYREAGGSFTDWPHIGPGLNTTITGLTSDTRYEVQVRATNDEGTGDWSPSGSGTPLSPPPGFAPVDQNAFNALVVDKVLSVETYYIEFVSAGRFEENNAYPGSYTYSNTGSNTGILTQNYDGGQLGGTCTIELTFSSTTTGTLRARCGSDENYDPPQEWLLSDAPDPSAFNIEVIWVGGEPSEDHRAAFNAAVTRWESIITSDIPDIFVDIRTGGETDGVKVFGLIDDLRIYARLTDIDGEGGTLGSAGPRLMRGQSKLPIVARMEFDTSDLGDFTPEALQDLFLHEMGHCLGVGTLWKRLGLLENPSIILLFGIIPVTVDDADTHFSGVRAIEAFNDAGGTDYTDGKVPVENEKGGAGTRDGHWRQSVFGPNELMEGFASPSAAMQQPLSAITIQSLADLGYIVNVNQADEYTLPSPAATKLAISSEHLIPINCIIIEPIGVIDEHRPIELKPKRVKMPEDQ